MRYWQVWALTLIQSSCTNTARNGLATTGLGMAYKSGSTLNLALVGDDGQMWTLVSSSR